MGINRDREKERGADSARGVIWAEEWYPYFIFHYTPLPTEALFCGGKGEMFYKCVFNF